METIIGIKQLHKDLKNVADCVLRGESFVVVKNSRPVFRIVPNESVVSTKYALKDLAKISFKGEKNLSRGIDKVLNG